MLESDEKVPPWNIRSLFPGKSEETIAEEAADYFNAISSEFNPLPAPPAPAELTITPPSTSEISEAIKTMKIPNSTVRGDNEPRLLKKFSHLLAVPLHHIFDRAFRLNCWPNAWKKETVHLIPKSTTPGGFADLRNLSCTPFFNKLMELFVLKDLKSTVKLSTCQYGGKKGQGVDHLLIEIWDVIHRSLEDSEASINIAAIDFHKAFNRMCHFSCIDALVQLGAKAHTVGKVSAFLHGRSMSVKIGNHVSSSRQVNGGAPQGSLLACFLFCATINNMLEIPPRQPLDEMSSDSFHTANDGSFSSRSLESPPGLDLSRVSSGSSEGELRFFRWRNNPLDDSQISTHPSHWELEEELGTGTDRWKDTLAEVKGYIDDFTVIEKSRKTNAISHFTQNKTVRHVHAQKCKEVFEDVGNISREIGMVINPVKTQLLSISPGTECVTKSYFDAGDTRINSGTSVKILGFWFSEKPTVQLHVGKLLSRARIRLHSLRRLKRGGLPSHDLLGIYKSMVRSLLDYTVPTYHSQLTLSQGYELECFQARAMKIVFGPTISYRTVLESGMIELLESRRDRLVEKFIRKTVSNEEFREKWFPPNEQNDYNLRRKETFKEYPTRTERLRKSPMFHFRRILNRN